MSELKNYLMQLQLAGAACFRGGEEYRYTSLADFVLDRGSSPTEAALTDERLPTS